MRGPSPCRGAAAAAVLIALLPAAAGGEEIRIARRGPDGREVVETVDLEDYVAAVVGAEMPPGFPPAALQAQAVAARTFAVLKKLEARSQGRDADLGASALSQVYPGRGPVDPRARAAAQATRGEVLVKDHLPIEAYYHSACGGRTESGADALGRDLPYLRSVECGRCQDSPKASWSRRIPAEEMGRVAGLGGPATSVAVTARTASGRAAAVEIASGGRRVRLPAAELRQLLGFDQLPSLAFTVREGPGAFLFDGRGSGHGAGLCQWGAAGWARAGLGYREILEKYYPGTEIVRMY